MTKITINSGKNDIQKLIDLIHESEKRWAGPKYNNFYKNKLTDVNSSIENKIVQLQDYISEEIDLITKEPEDKINDFSIHIIQEDGDVLKAGIPHVILREETIRLIFDSFYEEIVESKGVDHTDGLLFRTGRKIGRSFAFDLFDMLDNYNVQIDHTSDFINIFWSTFDAQGGYGKIILDSLTDDSINLSLKNSFLVSSYNSHRYCAWMRGYIYGALQVVLVELNYFNKKKHGLNIKVDKIRQLTSSTNHNSETITRNCIFKFNFINNNSLEELYELFYQVKYDSIGELNAIQVNDYIRSLFRCINVSLKLLSNNKIQIYNDLYEDANEFDHVKMTFTNTLGDCEILQCLEKMNILRNEIHMKGKKPQKHDLESLLKSFYDYLLNIHMVIYDSKVNELISCFENRPMFKS